MMSFVDWLDKSLSDPDFSGALTKSIIFVDTIHRLVFSDFMQLLDAGLQHQFLCSIAPFFVSSGPLFLHGTFLIPFRSSGVSVKASSFEICLRRGPPL